jgi:hypothetical protein
MQQKRGREVEKTIKLVKKKKKQIEFEKWETVLKEIQRIKMMDKQKHKQQE